ncbi:serine/threonine-protein kinase TBK1 [Zootermopsis nevadensis]|uniref:Serine/threonine-protein kinase TBK1 n=1 Tax=Zootermopsis nevadensis TaxID=136037 RepID=A0A067QRB7_ZOONE|nr:serine/threonine-protein kinase TBK1 [Zootermopsis nevadensis]KDR12239.1 Serine/threonine-protein kinase TBK1 [Zootermopsis nevadensis]
MSFLRGSANYVWCTTSVLGKGATGAVYQGVNKNNGEPVAVKTFNQLSHMRPHDVQVREFEVLKKVNHENIVKLLAIEEEQDGRGKVIVMELCTGGSLFNILDDPENTYGLQEEEFLLVLEHLSAGMKHLRDNRLVHRDLKPGNIMKFITDDGSTVYKLTDFGAARELEEDQQFMSLYGTEEYLHPDMYERAVLRKPVGKTFGATVDLWSIGVTLYHVATGNLPFRPFGGRRNKETMYYITTKKESGVISGLQTSENGKIEWSKDLPHNCQLSVGLKKLVTPLLAGLLEVDPQRIWNFERFFKEVTYILSCKLIHIFYMNRVQSIRVYLPPERTSGESLPTERACADLYFPERTYGKLQSLVQEQTDVAPANQILLYQESLLLPFIEDSTAGQSYPLTQDDKPLMLFSKENNNVTLAAEGDIPIYPSFPTHMSIETDASLAKTCCSVGHACKRQVEKLSRCSLLIHACVEQFTALVIKDLKNVEAKCRKLRNFTHCVEDTVETMVRAHNVIQDLMKILGNGECGSHCDPTVPSRELVNVLVPAIHQLHQQYVTKHALRNEWSVTTRDLPCPAKTRAPARARTMADRLRDSWQHLLRDRATRNLTYNDEQFHVLERIKISDTGQCLRQLLDKECQPAIAQLADALADWYKMAQTVYLRAHILDKDMDAYENRMEAFSERLAGSDCSFYQKLQATLDGKTRPAPVKQMHKVHQDVKVIHNSFKDIMAVQGEVMSMVKENSQILTQFHQLTGSLVVDGDNNGEEKL